LVAVATSYLLLDTRRVVCLFLVALRCPCPLTQALVVLHWPSRRRSRCCYRVPLLALSRAASLVQPSRSVGSYSHCRPGCQGCSVAPFFHDRCRPYAGLPYHVKRAPYCRCACCSYCLFVSCHSCSIGRPFIGLLNVVSVAPATSLCITHFEPCRSYYPGPAFCF
jgi:hypothetical protein